MPPAPQRHVNRGDISEMMGWSKKDLHNLRSFLCEPSQLRIWSLYLRRKDPDSNEKGPERKYLVKRAVHAIRNNEEKFTGNGTGIATKGDNQLWVVVRLVQDNRKLGCVWERKRERDLETMCETATEIMKMLSIEFSGKRSATSATVRRMKDMALINGIDLLGGTTRDVCENMGNVGRAKTYGHLGYLEEEDVANAMGREADDAFDDMEDCEQYTPADGINMFMLALIVGLVALVLVLLFSGRREIVLEKTQWTLK
jgi:hypothetical protein